MGLFDKFRKPKWQHEDPGVRLEAVKELDDQEILVKIAKNDSSNSVCKEAIRNIRDESVLIELVEDITADDYIYINDDSRLEAIRRINNQKFLAKLAKNSPHKKIRNVAVENIYDESVLCDIGMYSKYEDTRLRATKYLTKSTLKENIKSKHDLIKITECAELSVVERVIDDVDDELVLYNIWENNKKEEVKVFITKKINNEEILFKIAQTYYPNEGHSSNYGGRGINVPCGWSYRFAIEKIDNQDLLKKIVENPPRLSDAAACAIKKIDDDIYLHQYVKNKYTHKDIIHVKAIAIDNITSKHLLRDIINNEKHNYIKGRAESRLKNLKDK